ncbi:MAG: hypothetical protein EOM12_00170 [Verrucomicrobiae bacterium]|nr:hypothetical protein [Verrucomicrobiae bacterium]
MFRITRFIGRWVIRLLLLVILLGVLCYVFKDRALKYYVDVQLAKVTGLTIEAEKVNVDPLSRTLTLSNIEVSHPFIMKNLFLARLSSVRAKVSTWELIFNKLHFEELEVNVEVFQSVESSDGLSTEVYMRKLAENMDLGMGPWKYSGVDKFYLAINRHQKVNFETPEKIKSWRDLNSHVSFENVATPRDLLGILNTILYGELEPQRI